MLGPGIKTVFKSRWRALWWAGSILLSAVLFGARVDSIKFSVEGAPQQAETKHVNPWSKTPG